MMKDFELAAKRHAQIKEAGVASLAAKPLVAAAKWTASNPMKALGAAFTGAEIMGGAKRLSNSVRNTPVTGPGTFFAGPTRTM